MTDSFDKHEIRGRLNTDSKWILSTNRLVPTDVFGASLGEGVTRFIVAIWIPGDKANTVRTEILKKEEDGTYTTKFCPIPVAPADFRQVPKGAYSIEDPILKLAGGCNLAACMDTTGTSVNITVAYWDSDV